MVARYQGNHAVCDPLDRLGALGFAVERAERAKARVPEWVLAGPPAGTQAGSEARGTMQTIDREHLKTKIERGDRFKLVMTLPEAKFRLKHIPGSIHLHSPAEARRLLRPGEDIVVYSSCPECPASRVAARLLEERGYRHVWHYPGGVVDWEDAGYPLEGAWATRLPAHA